jgi:hypothetical protein
MDIDQLTDDELAAYIERELRAEVARFEQERQPCKTPDVLHASSSEHASNLYGVLQAAIDTVEGD